MAHDHTHNCHPRRLCPQPEGCENCHARNANEALTPREMHALIGVAIARRHQIARLFADGHEAAITSLDLEDLAILDGMIGMSEAESKSSLDDVIQTMIRRKQVAS